MFGMYGFLTTAITNASHFTYSGMAAVLKNQTLKWLETLEPALRRVVVLWATWYSRGAFNRDKA